MTDDCSTKRPAPAHEPRFSWRPAKLEKQKSGKCDRASLRVLSGLADATLFFVQGPRFRVSDSLGEHQG